MYSIDFALVNTTANTTTNFTLQFDPSVPAGQSPSPAFWNFVEPIVQLATLGFKRIDSGWGAAHEWLETNMQGYNFPRNEQQAFPGGTNPDGSAQELVDQKGGILTVGTDGSVWRNGVRLGNAFVSELKFYGDGVYGKGKTSGTWFFWSGSAWTQLDRANLDPNRFSA